MQYRSALLTLIALGAFARLAMPALAQQYVLEVEPNDTKDQATLAENFVMGDKIVLLDDYCDALDPVNYFRVRTAPGAPGIWRHRLVPTDWGAWGGPVQYTLVGREQSGGQVVPFSEALLQDGGSEPNSQPGFLQWYGFGRAEEVYVDLPTFQACRHFMELELRTAPVVPVDAGTFPVGTLEVSTSSAGDAIDTELWVFDAELHAVPSATSDDDGGLNASRIALAGLPGTYYVAVTDGNLALDRGPVVAPPGADLSDAVLDFPDGVTSSSDALPVTYDVTFSAGPALQTTFTFQKTEPFEVAWYVVHLTASGSSLRTFCPGDGSIGPCGALGTSLAGRDEGCVNGTARGAVMRHDWDVATQRVVAEHLPPGAAVAFFLSFSPTRGVVFGSGLACIDRGIPALAPVAADASGSAHAVLPSLAGVGFPSGSSAFVQALYRDPAALIGIPLNATSALEIIVP